MLAVQFHLAATRSVISKTVCWPADSKLSVDAAPSFRNANTRRQLDRLQQDALLSIAPLIVAESQAAEIASNFAAVAAGASDRASDAIAKALGTANALALNSAYVSAAAATQASSISEPAAEARAADGGNDSADSVSLTVSDLQSEISVAGECSLSTQPSVHTISCRVQGSNV